MVGSLGGAGGSTTGAATATNTNTQAAGQTGNTATKKGKSKDIDYCALIGAASEQVTGYQQNQYQKYLQEIPSSAENLQTDSLIKIKKNYRGESKEPGDQFNGMGRYFQFATFIKRLQEALLTSNLV